MQEILQLDVDSAKIRIEEELEAFSSDIVDSGEVGGAIAETNACCFEITEFTVQVIEADTDYLRMSFSFSASGEQMEDRMYCGTEISGSGIVLVKIDGEIEIDELGAGRVEYPDEYE